jgi:predicted lactoylglutathione lyase
VELLLLKSGLADRKNYLTLVNYLNLKGERYSREFKYLFKFIGDYYSRDPDTLHVAPAVLKEQIAVSLDNDKHVLRFHDMIDRAVGQESSDNNVVATILLAKEHEVGIAIATAIANGSDASKIDELIKERERIRASTSLSDLENSEEAEVIENIDIDSLIQQRLARGNLLEVYPSVINDRLDGGVEGGDHIILFGQTEIGKSAFSIQIASGFAYQGASGLYLINEDKTSRIAQRFASCLSGMDKHAMMNDPARAQARANERGMGNIRVIGITPGSLTQIEALVEKYAPRWVVLDQLRNINTGTRNNKVVQLDEAAGGMRNIYKAANCVGVSVTQAGASADNKIYLDVGDVDFSNVGIPAAADVMIGIGADERMKTSNERGVSLPKNKLSGEHAEMIVRIVPQLSQVRNA